MKFHEASEKIKSLQHKPTDEEMLQLYGLYKQATTGDINTDKPSFWNLVGKAKWEAWKTYEGISQDTAEKSYVALVELLLSKYQ